MAFPFLIDETFDDGTRGNFDSETDAGSVLDFPSYRELARAGHAPWQGAHALRVRLSGANNAYIEEATSITNQSPISLWFPLLVAADLTIQDGDRVNVIEVRSTNALPEAFVAVRRTGDNYELVAGEGSIVQRNYGTITRSNSRWYQMELTVNQANGTIDWYVDGGQVGSQITALSISPFTVLRLGAPSGTSASDAGTILIGRIIVDDARIFPRSRFGRDTIWVTRDQTVFIGDGDLDSIELTGTSIDAALTILDTDIFESGLTNFSREPLVYGRNISANEIVPLLTMQKVFHRGIYVQLTGTNPQAWISLGNGSVIESQSNYVDHARKSNRV